MTQKNPAPSPRAQAAAIQGAFPSYAVTVSMRQGDRPRFEVVTRNDDNPWCLISDDVDEIRHELEETPHV
jgi:hypothetical protein